MNNIELDKNKENTLIASILNIPNNTKYWFVRAGIHAKYYEDFYLNNYIGAEANGMHLLELYSIPQTLRSAPDAILDRYKQIFQKHDLSLFAEKNKNISKETETYKKDKRTATTQSTNRANRIFHFVEEMKIGDFIIVPHDNSTKYLIGVVISDCFDSPVNHIDISTADEEENGLGYDVSDFEFKRRIYWIKELNQNLFPDKLSWIRTAHQSIFNITENANDLNPYISPFYKYKNTYYMRLGVNSTQKISSADWLNYQVLIKNIIGEKNLNNIYQKQRVQSPGDIITYCLQNPYILTFISLIIFSGISLGGIDFEIKDFKMKLPGVLKYFSKSERIHRQVAVQEAQIEKNKNEITINQKDKIAKLENLKADNEIRKEEIKKLKLSNQNKEEKIREKELKEKLNNVQSTLKERNIINTDKIKKLYSINNEDFNLKDDAFSITINPDEIQHTLKSFELSNENPGVSISDESQEDNLSQ